MKILIGGKVVHRCAKCGGLIRGDEVRAGKVFFHAACRAKMRKGNYLGRPPAQTRCDCGGKIAGYYAGYPACAKCIAFEVEQRRRAKLREEWRNLVAEHGFRFETAEAPDAYRVVAVGF